MKDEHILKRLNEIPDKTWIGAIAKCHNHIMLRLSGKTSYGAHCEQRLGMDAKDYYVGTAIKSLFGEVWEWKYQQYTIDEQLIRIIDSMISEQVRKYKIEAKQGKKTKLVANDQLALYLEDGTEEEYDEIHYEKLSTALKMACENNEKYKQFVELKQQNLNYSEIAKQMGCTSDDLYQIMENVSRRSQKILKSL